MKRYVGAFVLLFSSLLSFGQTEVVNQPVFLNFETETLIETSADNPFTDYK